MTIKPPYRMVEVSHIQEISHPGTLNDFGVPEIALEM